MEINNLAPSMISNNPISQNFYLHAHFLPSLHEKMKVQKTNNLVFIDCGLSCDTFNILYITNGFEVTHNELNTAIKHYEKKAYNYCLWVDEENLTENVGQLLRQLKIHEAGNEQGMILTLDNYKVEPVAGDIRLVTDEDQIREFAELLATAWTPPDEHVVRYYDQVAASILTNKHAISFYLYYQNNKPVSAMEIFPSDHQTSGIYNLVTLEAYRGAGIGTKMMKFALNQLINNNFKRVVLQASDDGLNIYSGLGFEETARYFEFQKI